MNIKWKLTSLSIILFSIGLSTVFTTQMRAYAHGVEIAYTVNTTVNIVATYDNGESMAGAQFTVYAPDDPANPWLSGLCDDQGRFSFTPDNSAPGTWDVQVRKAGHGDIVHIPVGSNIEKQETTGGYTVNQIVLMSLCVVWGFIGTALYIKRRRS
jgi:nickel transport protein